MNTPNSDVKHSASPSIERHTLVAIFRDGGTARQAMNDLRAFGLRNDQIGLAMHDRQQQDKLVEATGIHATAGALGTGDIVRTRRSLRGLLADLFVFVFPGQPSLPLATAPVVASSAVLPGGMMGALLNLQIPEVEARRREAGSSKGSVLVTAKVFEGVAEAQGIMKQHGGSLVERAEYSA